MRCSTWRRSPSRVGGDMAGFTLIEVLVALAMALLLLTAVYSAIDMHWRFESAGQLELQRGQVARAVYGRLSIDIRSVQFVAPDPEEAELEDDESDDGELVDDEDIDDLFQMQSLGVIGTSTRLTLHVNKPVPPRSFAFDEADEAIELMESEQRSVTWFLADLGGGELEGMSAARFSDDQAIVASGLILGVSPQDGPLGLARSEVDRLTGSFDEPAESESSLAEAAEFLAPEINSLSFRYFDGIDWQEEWDSLERGAIPAAIEIVIGFVPPDPEDVLQQTASDAIPSSYRFVVALPVAEESISESDF